jgi:Fic family protein
VKPPYEITAEILNLLTAISEKIGEVNAAHLHKPSLKLRKKNRVQTIRASLEIEGNALSEEQITAILENKRVAGPKKDIIEAVNAVEVYDRVKRFDPNSLKSFLQAHRILMNNLVENPGKLRSESVGILKGDEVAHIAPPAENLDFLLKDLFDYLTNSDDHVLIKSCVAHYEIEFIHPFMDGNGRMGRLWQTLILMQSHPVFAFLPFETVIKERQRQYYATLEECDDAGDSTRFIEFILNAINASLADLLKIQNRNFSNAERVDYFISVFQDNVFTRKDYLNIFKNISPATASRDLRYAVDKGFVEKMGDKRTAQYRISKRT